MKQAILNFALLTIVFLSSCKKDETLPSEDPLITKAKTFVKSQVSESNYSELDWSRVTYINRDGKHEIVKIPLIGNIKGTDKSIYLKVAGESFEGNYFELKLGTAYSKITTSSLDTKRVSVSTIEDQVYKGDTKIYENGNLIAAALTPTYAVSIVGNTVYYTIDNSVYMSAIFLGIGTNGWQSVNYNNGMYETLIPVDDAGSGGNTTPEIIEFELNDWEAKAVADITKIFNCFDLVPNGANTTYEITLNADIPSNRDESIPFLLNGNPGHAFITLTKKNGTQSVTQNFGFYPNSGPKSLGLGNVSSKIVDDNNHEVNASIKMNINSVVFEFIKQDAILYATHDYNLESNNCANFAIDLFNIGRLNADITVTPFQVTVPLPFLPPINAVMAKSPHMLYAKLSAMKTSGHPEAANIQVNRNRDLKSGNSHGECQ